jgi:L-ascorbate metabolism protein UlaG (beta-lactamase superfamily)
MLIQGLDISRPSHACIKIINASGKVFYIDPFQLQTSERADYLFITHEHYDHCSVADIRKIIKPDTIIVTVPDCQSKVAGLPVKEVKLVKPGDSFKLPHCDVQVLPAYNLKSHFHLKDNQWVGFAIRIDGKVLYHVGDSDAIPELKNLKGIDVLFIPVSGHYVMSAEEAAQLVNFLKPKVAIPIHYGAIIGTKEDAERFKSLVQGTEVIIL